MGQCCGNEYQILSEEFIHQILTDPIFKLNSFDYNTLLNEIVSKRIQQEIHKKHIEQILLPTFYNTKSNSANKKYIQNILNHVLTQLQEKNNMYSVIMYFYPFINHNKENAGENMNSIFRFVSGDFTVEMFEKLLTQYFYFCTRDLTYAVWKVCDDPKISKALDELNTIVYSEDNIKKVVARIVFEMSKRVKDNKGIDKGQVTEDNFKQVFAKYNFASAENVRNLVISGGY